MRHTTCSCGVRIDKHLRCSRCKGLWHVHGMGGARGECAQCARQLVLPLPEKQPLSAKGARP